MEKTVKEKRGDKKMTRFAERAREGKGKDKERDGKKEIKRERIKV